jgi:hypothetical protein
MMNALQNKKNNSLNSLIRAWIHELHKVEALQHFKRAFLDLQNDQKHYRRRNGYVQTKA